MQRINFQATVSHVGSIRVPSLDEQIFQQRFGRDLSRYQLHLLVPPEKERKKEGERERAKGILFQQQYSLLHVISL